MGLILSPAEIAKLATQLGWARRQAAAELGSKLYASKPIGKAGTLNDIYHAMQFKPGYHDALDESGQILQRIIRTGPKETDPSFKETSYYGPDKLNEPSQYALNSPLSRFFNARQEVPRLRDIVGHGPTFNMSTGEGFANAGDGNKFYRMLGYNADSLVDAEGTPMTKLPDLYTHDNLMANTVAADAIATQRLQEGLDQPFPTKMIWNNDLGQFKNFGSKFRIPQAVQDVLGPKVPALPHGATADMNTGYFGEMDRLNTSPLQELRDQAYGHNALRNMVLAHRQVPGLGAVAMGDNEGMLAARQAATLAQKHTEFTHGLRSMRLAQGDLAASRAITEGRDVDLDALIESMRGAYQEGGSVH